MNINIYYGGRGIIDDPTIYVINKMQEILEELSPMVRLRKLNGFLARERDVLGYQRQMEGKTLVKTIVVKGKIVNLILK